MIKKVFYLIAATIVFANCSNAPQAPTSFVVEGTLPDSSFHGEQIYMQRYTDGKTMGVTKVEGNRFTFTGVADSADYCRIEVGPRLYSIAGRFFTPEPQGKPCVHITAEDIPRYGIAGS